MIKYVILIPSFNDWECLNLLIPKIDQALKNTNENVDVLIVNDGSTKKNNLVFKKMSHLKKIEVLNLRKNVKAQIAIATGLNFLKKEKFQGGIIVMDADGQDDPEYLVDIIKQSKQNHERTITINRTKRDDELLFKILYQMYLFLLFLLTFKYLKFGVYSYLHSSSLDKILSTNDIHLAYAASLAKHFKNKNVIFAPRKKRILGESQNNYKSLTHYALKIISVFRNQVLINSIVLVFISFLLSKLITSSALFLFILLALLFFNVIIFLLAYQINKSHLVNDSLKNIENIENLGNELL
jgi:glycosyltransferase involved in cell wall biosynthesis